MVEFEPNLPNLPNLPTFGHFTVQFNQFLIKFDYFRSELVVGFEFGPRFRIGFIATSNRTAGIESKIRLKSIPIRIKNEFPADLDLIALA